PRRSRLPRHVTRNERQELIGSWLRMRNGADPVGRRVTIAHDSDEIILVTSGAEWQIPTRKNNGQSGFFNHCAKSIDRGPGIVLLQYDDAARLQKGRNGTKEIEMNAPIWIMRAQISKILINEMGRVGNDQIPLLGFRHVTKIVRAVDRDSV